MKKFFYVFWCLLIVSCSSIDCPLNNRVATIYKLQGKVDVLSDSLTVSTSRFEGNDTVLLNRAIDIDSFLLPISYNHPEDVLYFRRHNASGWSVIDTVVIKKQDIPHLESIDCPAAYFHQIQSISYTRRGIDSIVVNRADVSYDTSRPHLYLYLKEHND